MKTITRECPECGQITELFVSEKAFALYKDGTPALQAFPNMTIDERTTLVFGLCPECIAKLENN